MPIFEVCYRGATVTYGPHIVTAENEKAAKVKLAESLGKCTCIGIVARELPAEEIRELRRLGGL